MVLLFLFCGCVDANEVSKASSFLTPRICIVPEQKVTCSMQVSVEWDFNQEGSYCLFLEEVPMKCWYTVSRIKESFDITFSNNDLVALKSKQGNTIKTEKLRVVSATSRKFRRKLKNDWSIF
ncbi:DUF3019 domain-containing protein [Pseudoalteromonas xiamenensis]